MEWITPPSCVVKIHVDATIGRHEDRGCFAAVCRDETHMFLGASTIVVPYLISLEILEAMTSNEALSLAINLACNKTVCCYR